MTSSWLHLKALDMVDSGKTICRRGMSGIFIPLSPVARIVGGPPENFEKIVYLRPHFVRFEECLLGNKPYKGEVTKDNNSGSFLNSKRSFRNIIYNLFN